MDAHPKIPAIKTLALDETIFSDVFQTIACEGCLALDRPGERLHAAQPFDPMLPRVLAPEVSRVRIFRSFWK